MSLIVDIRKKFKGFTLNVKFETSDGYLGILGASGSGKSMTLKCIAGVETPNEGRIILNGRVLYDSENKVNLRPQSRNIGYLFQNYALFPNMTVEENIGAGIRLSKKEKKAKVNEMINIFQLKGMEKKYPSMLSGGQQQRVALSRIIAYEPDVLLLDEPFSALDSHLKEQLQAEILELLKLYKGEVIMVTHSRDEAYRFCKNLVIIDKGNSVMFGDTKEIFKQPKLLSTARLTGCKNISKCEVLSSNKIYAIDWDITLETEKPMINKFSYIGIRAHNIQMVDNLNDKNSIKFKIIKIVEEVFEYTVVVENENIKNSNSNSTIWFKVRKEEWNKRNIKENIYLKIPEDAILMLV